MDIVARNRLGVSMKLFAFVIQGLVIALLAACAQAQSNPLYIQFSPAAVKGALTNPTRRSRLRTSEF
jgi:hypothetical protein